MPVPPLPNELVTLIFEHLFRILSVHPAEEFLDAPETAPFVFGRFSSVSRTWYRLAAPFLLRHLEGDDLACLSNLHPDKLVAIKSARWSWTEFSMQRNEEGRTWAWFVEAAAATVEQLWFTRWLENLAFLAFLSSKQVALPALRRLTLNAPEDYQFDFLGLLARLADRAPQLEHLTLTSHDRYLQPPAPTSPAWRLDHLRVLDLRNFHVKPEWLRTVFAERLIRPSRNSLSDLSLDVKVHRRLGEPFATLFPFTFPHLTSLHCTSSAIDCQTLDIATSLPRVRSLTLSIPSPTPTLPDIPSTIQHLHLVSLDRAAVSLVANVLIDALLCVDDANFPPHAPPRCDLRNMRILSLTLHKDKLPHNLEDSVINLRRLVTACSARGITMHSDMFGTIRPVEVDETSTDVSEAKEALDQALAVVQPFAQRWRPLPSAPSGVDGAEGSPAEEGQAADDGSEGSSDEGEDDWDAEDDPVFKMRWSLAKRAAYEADQAFLSLPPDLFSSPEARETAKSTMAQTIERALEEERSANDEGDEAEEGTEDEEEEEVEVQSDDFDALRWLEGGL